MIKDPHQMYEILKLVNNDIADDLPSHKSNLIALFNIKT